MLVPSEPEQKGGVAVCTPDGHVRKLREIEADIVCLAMSHYGGQISQTARYLQIGRSTLYRKLDEFGIDGRSDGC